MERPFWPFYKDFLQKDLYNKKVFLRQNGLPQMDRKLEIRDKQWPVSKQWKQRPFRKQWPCFETMATMAFKKTLKQWPFRKQRPFWKCECPGS